MVIDMQEITRIYDLGGQSAEGRSASGGQVRAADGISLQVEAGEFVAVVGPSGSGKSTLMNLLACLDTPSSGRYFLDGVEVGRLDDDALSRVRNHKVGLVFQSYNLLPRMTALENVALPLLYGASAEDGEAARAALEAVGLGERAHHWPSQLSGGQQQRVAIARALVTTPAVILADEPTGALDTRSGLEVMEILQRLNRDGRTVIVVTHEQPIAEHARRVISLRDGRLVADEPVARPRQAEAELAKLVQGGVAP
jgi:putative ABC transport system ATP-binding protein